MRRLQQAGYPLTANDLTLEEWFDLGRINEHFDNTYHHNTNGTT